MNISVRYAPVLQSEFNGQDASLAYSCLLKLRSRTAEERDHQPTEGCVEKGRKEFLSNSAIHNLPDASAPGLDFSTTEKGADLLQDKVNANVALVESEKTAVICSILLPEYTWLATGGKSQFNDRLMVLKGRKVTAFSVIARRNSIPRRTAADSFSYIGFSQSFATIRLRVYPNRPSHSSCCFHWSLAV